MAGTAERAPDTASTPVELLVEDRVGHLVLNRPAKLNAIDGATLQMLAELVEQIERDASIRAVVVRGRGRAFCAGADLSYVRARLGSAETYAAFLEEWHRVFGLLERCAKPTIAAVHGVALAGGLELTQVCDVVIAAEDARFGDQHAKLGLFPGGGSTQRLPRLVGQRRARWMLLSGEHVSAVEALEFGMVNRVVPAEQLLDVALHYATTLAELSLDASTAIKRATLEGAELALEDGLRLERSIAVAHMLGPDPQIGLRAFEQGDTPVFTGTRVDGGLADAVDG